jgi:hypothetical protein
VVRGEGRSRIHDQLRASWHGQEMDLVDDDGSTTTTDESTTQAEAEDVWSAGRVGRLSGSGTRLGGVTGETSAFQMGLRASCELPANLRRSEGAKKRRP